MIERRATFKAQKALDAYIAKNTAKGKKMTPQESKMKASLQKALVV